MSSGTWSSVTVTHDDLAELGNALRGCAGAGTEVMVVGPPGADAPVVRCPKCRRLVEVENGKVLEHFPADEIPEAMR